MKVMAKKLASLPQLQDRFTILHLSMSRKYDHFLKALPSCAGYDQTSFLGKLETVVLETLGKLETVVLETLGKLETVVLENLGKLETVVLETLASMVGLEALSDNCKVIARLSQSSTGIGLEIGSDKTVLMQIAFYHEYKSRLCPGTSLAEGYTVAILESQRNLSRTIPRSERELKKKRTSRAY